MKMETILSKETRPATLRFILYSTIGCLFSERAYYHHIIDLKLFYMVLAINLGLMLTLFRPTINVRHSLTLAYLAISGCLGLIFGTTPLSKFLFAFVGISICSAYYYNFFRLYMFDAKVLFDLYAKTAAVVSAIGIPIALLMTSVTGRVYKLKSVMQEPSHLALLVMPALYFYLDRAQSERRVNLGLLTIFVALLMSDSSVGYVGMGLSTFFLLARNIKTGVLAGAILLTTFIGINHVSSQFRNRVQDTISVVKSGYLGGDINLSTFALLANAQVAAKSFLRNPFLGGGLGSHEQSHYTFFDSIPGVRDNRHAENLLRLNCKDAASLASRIVSELGIPGVVFATLFLFRYRATNNAMNTGVFVYLLLKLLRDGHYFTPEFYFFVMVYILTGIATGEKHEKVAG